jgi:hypothetical protein
MKLIKKIVKFVFWELKTWNCDLFLIEFGENTQFWHTLFEKLCTHVAHMSTRPLHFSIRARRIRFYDLWRTPWKKNSKFFRVKFHRQKIDTHLQTQIFFVPPFPCTKLNFSNSQIFSNSNFFGRPRTLQGGQSASATDSASSQCNAFSAAFTAQYGTGYALVL